MADEVQEAHARQYRRCAMPNGELTRSGDPGVQPDWLAQVPTDRRFPDGRVLLTGCGTSFHAAQTGGEAVQALELVLAPRPGRRAPRPASATRGRRR